MDGAGWGRSTSVIPAVPAASSVTTIAFIRPLPTPSSDRSPTSFAWVGALNGVSPTSRLAVGPSSGRSAIVAPWVGPSYGWFDSDMRLRPLLRCGVLERFGSDPSGLLERLRCDG